MFKMAEMIRVTRLNRKEHVWNGHPTFIMECQILICQQQMKVGVFAW